MIKHCILTEMLSFCTLLQYFYLLKQCIQLDNDMKGIYSAITKSEYKIRNLFVLNKQTLIFQTWAVYHSYLRVYILTIIMLQLLKHF